MTRPPTESIVDLLYRETQVRRRPHHKNKHLDAQAEYGQREVALDENTPANVEQAQLAPGTSADATNPDWIAQRTRASPNTDSRRTTIPDESEGAGSTSSTAR